MVVYENSLGNPSLQQLARDGETAAVLHLLGGVTHCELDTYINASDDDKFTALHYAARYNRLTVVELLLDRGANPNAQGDEGISPLHFAARYHRSFSHIRHTQKSWSNNVTLENVKDNEEVTEITSVVNFLALPQQMPNHKEAEHTVTISIIDRLVKSGADINDQDMYGLTPLHYAAMRGNDIVAQHLLQYSNIEVEVLDYQGMTPLHIACSHDRTEMVQLLLEADANVLARDGLNITPLHYAAQSGNLDIVCMLANNAEKHKDISELIISADYEGNTALHLAVDSRHEHIAKVLLDLGFNVNAQRKMGESALHSACVSGSSDIVEFLISRGANINTKTVTLSTPLHVAAAYDHCKIAEILLDNDANVESRDYSGLTPLLVASQEGCSDTLKLFWSKGANTEAVDRLDQTALFLASANDNRTIVDFITSTPAGRNLVEFVDRYGNTPLHIAAQQGFMAVIKTLIKQGAQVDPKNEDDSTPLHLAAQAGMNNVVRELISSKPGIIYDGDEDSNTALHLAALHGHEEVIKELLRSGADIRERNAYLWTPLDCAAGKGWINSVKILLEEGAPLDPLDRTKTTPLQLAAKNGWCKTVSALLDYGAQVDLKDIQDQTALTLAIQNGHSYIRNVAMVLVNHDSWFRSLVHSRTNENSELLETPLRLLIKRMPEVAECVFDKCMVAHGQADSDGYKIEMNYILLEDAYLQTIFGNPSATKKTVELRHLGEKVPNDAEPYSKDRDLISENHVLSVMVHHERAELLSHPLALGLLRLKWNKFGRYVYYSTLMFYGLFLFFLTSYLTSTPATYTYFNGTLSDHDSKNVCCIVAERNPDAKQLYLATVSKYTLMFALVPINILRELFQLSIRGFRYLTFGNLLELTIYITAILFVIDFGKCCAETGTRQEWQWQLGACCIFMAWLNLVLLIRKFPQFGIYVVMFIDIFWTFCRFFIVFILLFIAFAFAFYALLQNHYPFRSFQSSILKTIVMMIGELDFDTLFNDPANVPIYQKPTYLLYVIFLFIMTILIMNLLVGLAVDDIQSVQEKAKMKKLAMQVRLVMEVENSLPDFLLRRNILLKQEIYPNKGIFRLLKRFFVGNLSAISINSIANEVDKKTCGLPGASDPEKVAAEVSVLKRQVKNLQRQNNQVSSMMSSMMQHFNIKSANSDIDILMLDQDESSL